MVFKKVGAVILLVNDMDSSVRFYRDILNVPVKTQTKEWTEFITSGTVIALHPSRKKVETKQASNMLIGFMVSDLDEIAKQLEQKNVKFFKLPKEEPFGKHAIIEDPDGHLISIAEIKSKSTEGFDLIGFFGAE
jgi:lactoylglutathione lyase